MVFEYILEQNDIDPSAVNIDQSIDFGSTAAAFAGGQAEYTVEFEPSATALEKEGTGYVIASLGVDSGYVPYTAFSAKASYMEENPEVIQAFVNALQKGMEYVNTHSPGRNRCCYRTSVHRHRSGYDHNNRHTLSGSGYLEKRPDLF